MTRIRLLVFNPALPVLDYRLPAGMAIEFGQLVIAPLGPRHVLGIVWEPERLGGEEVAAAKLRPILEVLPVPPLSAPLRRLIEWCAEYYVAPIN
ncbi:MAG: primosomal protein N', partial [Sphingomonadales bacterium]|nr:primosomal protein N' [Sphingomonadales bacterium]